MTQKMEKLYFVFILNITSNIINTRTIVKNRHKGEDKAIMQCLQYENSHNQILTVPYR